MAMDGGGGVDAPRPMETCSLGWIGRMETCCSVAVVERDKEGREERIKEGERGKLTAEVENARDDI